MQQVRLHVATRTVGVTNTTCLCPQRVHHGPGATIEAQDERKEKKKRSESGSSKRGENPCASQMVDEWNCAPPTQCSLPGGACWPTQCALRGVHACTPSTYNPKICSPKRRRAHASAVDMSACCERQQRGSIVQDKRQRSKRGPKDRLCAAQSRPTALVHVHLACQVPTTGTSTVSTCWTAPTIRRPTHRLHPTATRRRRGRPRRASSMRRRHVTATRSPSPRTQVASRSPPPPQVHLHIPALRLNT